MRSKPFKPVMVFSSLLYHERMKQILLQISRCTYCTYLGDGFHCTNCGNLLELYDDVEGKFHVAEAIEMRIAD